jgi:hypothetical protein
VIRVLNLWQKNGVFTTEDIQPLFDMANAQSEIYRSLDQQMKTTGKIQVTSSGTPVKEEKVKEEVRGGGASNGAMDKQAQQQLQSIQQLLKNPPPVQFNKKLLDFDYSDEEDEGGREDPVPASSLEAVKALLGNPTLLAHLQSTGEISQQQIQQLQQLLPGAPSVTAAPPPAAVPAPQQQFAAPGGGGIPGLGGGHGPAAAFQPGGGPHFLAGGRQGPGGYHGAQATPPGFGHHQLGMAPPTNQFGHAMGLDARLALGGDAFGAMRAVAGPGPQHLALGMGGMPRQSPLEEGEHAGGDTDDDVMMIDEIDSKRGGGRKDVRRAAGRRSRSRSDSRSKTKRRRSKSRSRSRDRSRRRRSRSREATGYRERDGRDEEKKRAVREEEEARLRDRQEDRKKKGLPGMKEGHMTVCSTTLWVGHLSKLVQEDDLSDNFGTYGEVSSLPVPSLSFISCQIVSIDLITPRGCAFVCMNRRMDAYRWGKCSAGQCSAWTPTGR